MNLDIKQSCCDSQMFFMSPTKHGRHRDHFGGGGVRIVLLWVSCRKRFKRCINFIQTLQKGQASLNTGQVRKLRSSANFLLSYGPFLLDFC